jgi:catechol 2,3-dioxygenase-like lactoylglutathione lyase family enzyme
MQLGAFSISLPVDDLTRSVEFYGHLGFTRVGGDDEQGYAMLANGTTIIGLFVGHVERPMLTFNPGLTNGMDQLTEFTDVREIQQHLVDAGCELSARTDPEGVDPAHIALADPDGHPILIDQFFPRPEARSD